EDLKYEILDDFEYAKFPLNSYSVLKTLIKVYKKNGQTKIYPWYSIDFNVHYHLFKGYSTTDKLNYTNANLWDVFKHKNNKLIVPKGLDANEFFTKNIEKIISFVFWKNRNNLIFWNNKSLLQTEALELFLSMDKSKNYLHSTISNIILSYLISNDENDFLSGIDDINIDFIGVSNPGKLQIKIDFLNKNLKSLLTDENKNKIIEIDFFKGTTSKYVKENYIENKKLTIENSPLIAHFIKNN
ncbi:MAG3240 family lipoprotein, partial [Mycoplasmopsis alligatoris]